MPASNVEKEFVFYVIELMQSIGPVRAKGIFGGHGVFLEALMFGLIADGTLYLKADKETESEFKDRGLEAFKYHKKGKEFKSKETGSIETTRLTSFYLRTPKDQIL